MFDDDTLGQAAHYLNADFLKSLVVALLLTPIFYVALLLIEEATITVLCREILRCAAR